MPRPRARVDAQKQPGLGTFTPAGVSENGGPVENLVVNERVDPNQGISVVLVLDVSGSMLDDIGALRAAGVELGRTYPRPVVDLRESRDKALAGYADLKRPE